MSFVAAAQDHASCSCTPQVCGPSILPTRQFQRFCLPALSLHSQKPFLLLTRLFYSDPAGFCCVVGQRLPNSCCSLKFGTGPRSVCRVSCAEGCFRFFPSGMTPTELIAIPFDPGLFCFSLLLSPQTRSAN